MTQIVSIGTLEREGAILAIQDGNHGEIHPTAKDYVPEGVPFVMSRNIQGGRLKLESCERIPLELASHLRVGFAKTGDVLLTHKGTLGETARVPSVDPYVVLTPQVTYYRTDPRLLDPGYLMYAFQYPGFRAQMESIGNQSTRPFVSITTQRHLNIFVYPLPIQRKIAAVLSYYDNLIGNNDRRIEILEEMARRIYREWFVDLRYPGNEGVALVDSALGPVPEGWIASPLFDVAEVTFGYPFKSALFNATEGTPVIRIRDISVGESQTLTTEAAATKYDVADGDILVGMDGDFHMGRWSSGKALLNQRVVRFRPSSRTVCRYALFLALERPISNWNQAIVGTTVAHLGKRHLEMIRVVAPPPALAVQAARLLDPMFDLEIKLRKANRNLRRSRDILLPRLLSGEVDLSGVDISMPEAAA